MLSLKFLVFSLMDVERERREGKRGRTRERGRERVGEREGRGEGGGRDRKYLNNWFI